MNFFKDFTFHWWQFGLMKISLIALGILAGSYWAAYFKNKKATMLLWAAFLAPAIYLAVLALRQAR